MMDSPPQDTILQDEAIKCCVSTQLHINSGVRSPESSSPGNLPSYNAIH